MHTLKRILKIMDLKRAAGGSLFNEGSCFGVTDPQELRPPLPIRRLSYTCKDAKKDIDFYFSGEGKATREQEKAIKRAVFKHMTIGSTIEKHNIACRKCWNYYQRLKRKYCGG